jgi:hypothetical protein
MGCALIVIDGESDRLVFADMAADRKSARAVHLGQGGCWLAFYCTLVLSTESGDACSNRDDLRVEVFPVPLCIMRINV